MAAMLFTSSLPAQNPPARPQTEKSESSSVPVLPKAKKLILTDGSFQLVQSYEIKGDRVRYYSVERSVWEELPSSLVDWNATRKAEAEDTTQEQAVVEKLKAEEAAKRVISIDVDASIEVAPGLFLPPGEGVFVLDGKAVLPLTQAEADIKTNKGRVLEQVLVPIPIVPGRRTVFLAGPHAKFRITNREPEFYMRTADGREPKIELIQAQIYRNTRQIEYLDQYFAQQTSKRKTLLLQSWPVAKGVYRFTLGQLLEPGEYAIAEILDRQDVNLFLWDLGVDAAPKK